MASQTPGLQTYNSAFPFIVALQNQYMGEELPVLYIVENNKSTAELQKINIKIAPKTDDQFLWSGFDFETPTGTPTTVSGTPSVAPSKTTFTPDQSKFNLAIAIRPGVLADAVIPQFSHKLQTALGESITAIMKDGGTNNVCVNGPIVRASDNALVWYCAIQNDLYFTDGLEIKLQDISAYPGVGARNTQIEVILSNLLINAGSNPISFSRSIHVDIINHAGVSTVPLTFSVYGLNTFLLSSADTPAATTATPGQDLSIYCETIDKTPLEFGANTKFKFYFSYFENDSDIIGFGTRSQVGGITWDSATPTTIFNAENTEHPKFTDQYTADPQGPETAENGLVPFSIKYNANSDVSINPVSCIFKFNGLIFSGVEGAVLLHVKVENLPGYWDTNFQVPIIKATSILHDRLELGLSSLASKVNSRSGVQSSQIAMLSGGHTQNDKNKPQVSIEEDWGLNLYGEPSDTSNTIQADGTVTQSGKEGFPGRPVKVRDADFLVPEGRVGINSGNDTVGNPHYPDTSNSNEKLYVGGDTNLKGKLHVNEAATIDGQLALGKSKSDGYFKDGYGSRIDLLSAGNRTPTGRNNPIANVSIVENNGLNLIGTATQPVSVVNTDLIVSDGRIKDKTGDVMPVGSIIAYGGGALPPGGGWLLCDNGTFEKDTYPELYSVLRVAQVPDLRSKFIVGAGQAVGTDSNGQAYADYALNAQGGERNHTLTIAEMPKHSHGDRWNVNNNGGTTGYNGQNGQHDHEYQSQIMGGGHPHNNLPPYYALTYIIKC